VRFRHANAALMRTSLRAGIGNALALDFGGT